MAAAVRLYRDHRVEAAVYGHQATVAVTASAAVVVDHHHFSGGGCWKKMVQTM